jgi:hypothetical protein
MLLFSSCKDDGSIFLFARGDGRRPFQHRMFSGRRHGIHHLET